MATKRDGGLTCCFCLEESPKMERCAACKKVWYCSKGCQEDHWYRHIFDCQYNKPISTVYYLARAMYSDVIPIHAQTRIDYGFDKARDLIGGPSESNLCGLYKGLLMYLNVPMKDLRAWQKAGRLVEEIKAVYEKVPVGNRGGYYPWFLEHQYILDGRPVDVHVLRENAEKNALRLFRAGWTFIYKTSEASTEEILSQRAAYSPERRECFDLYSMLLEDSRPPPTHPSWLSFGFVAAANRYEENTCTRMYQTLIHRCTFDEFCAAFQSCSLLALFDTHRVTWSPPDSELKTRFDDIMSGSPRVNKSVWDLKHYIDQLISSLPSDTPPLIRSVAFDYGFGNCEDASDRRLLDKLYTRLFEIERMSPLALHQACIQGELLQFVRRFVDISSADAAKYERLLKNVYPIPYPVD